MSERLTEEREVLATQFRAAADRCCQCTDGHHDWIPDFPYGTDGDVRLTRDLARKVARLLDERDALAARLAEVLALADEWDATVYKLPPGYPMTVNEFCRRWFKAPLRAALASDPDTGPAVAGETRTEG